MDVILKHDNQFMRCTAIDRITAPSDREHHSGHLLMLVKPGCFKFFFDVNFGCIDQRSIPRNAFPNLLVKCPESKLFRNCTSLNLIKPTRVVNL